MLVEQEGWIQVDSFPLDVLSFFLVLQIGLIVTLNRLNKNMRRNLIIFGALTMLSAGDLFAENAVILESFEENIDSVTQGDWGGARIPDGVVFQQYTKQSADDINVTHGTKSLQVNLSVAEGWVHDFKITLSEEASAKIREAAASADPARYIVRYDIIFPPPGTTAWMNNQVFFGSISDELGSDNGKQTMSLALDLITGLPADGQIVIRFADNFDATEDPFTGLTLYVDNVRLVDTYAPGAQPVIYVLQSFEDNQNATGGVADFIDWGGVRRTTYSQYTATGPEDIAVTHGTKSLKVNFAGAGTWNADFVLPLADTKLAEILKLDRPAEERPTAADLGRYTLRFDVIYPDRAEDWPDGWLVSSFNTLAEGLPYSLARKDQPTGERQTVSITLDQIAWSEAGEIKPRLMFIVNGAWGPSGTTIYYDNFRLIDTGVTAAAPGLKITTLQYNASTSQITLKWDSVAGKTYTVDFTDNLGSWPQTLANNIPGVQGTTTFTGTVPNPARGFLRVRTLN
jgi:hypothetical protein